MPDIQNDYKLPDELTAFIDSNFLKLLFEDDAEKTITFDIPSLAWTDERGRDITFTLLWIHPDFNEQFCHYYDERPGDLANFYVFKETSDSGNEWLDIKTFDDLICWLSEREG